jgi:nucleoside-diphosphate-sugar epimerase
MFSIRKNFPVFLTGASGFIGGQLALRLLADGRRVRALSRWPLPELEARGAEVIPGDLDDIHALRRGCASAESVFHIAGRVGVWGSRREFFQVNVEGTRQVLAACLEAGVSRLIYTSSPSVVYTGADLRNVDESAPLCTAAPCAYPTSKAAAEREVLAAHGKAISTIALRPSGIFGEHDALLVPTVVAKARQGKMKYTIGGGQNLMDWTYAGNVAAAHLAAAPAPGRPGRGRGPPPRRVGPGHRRPGRRGGGHGDIAATTGHPAGPAVPARGGRRAGRSPSGSGGTAARAH